MKLRMWVLSGVLVSLVLVGVPGTRIAQVDEGSRVEGMIDIHAHVGPETLLSPFRRSVNAIEAAQIAKRNGMRGLVFKHHYLETASWAYLVMQMVPGIELFGGIALNRPWGGINPVAVENMASVLGSRGRVVYMPTFESENYNPGSPDAVPISRNGRLLPEVLEVLDIMAEYDLGLSTGHSTAEESMMLIAAARAAGVDKIYVQHPQGGRINMSMDMQKEAARMGAFIEHTIGRGGLNEEDFAGIRELGPENVVITSDVGQRGSPLHPDAFKMAVADLLEAGFTKAEIDMMTKRNPARFLGLD